MKATYKTAPKGARIFANGDICVKLEPYVAKTENFGYYEKTESGFKLEKSFWRGKAASSYNYVKEQPGFVPTKTFEKKKKAVAKVKAKAPKRKTKAELELELAELKTHMAMAVVSPEVMVESDLKEG